MVATNCSVHALSRRGHRPRRDPDRVHLRRGATSASPPPNRPGPPPRPSRAAQNPAKRSANHGTKPSAPLGVARREGAPTRRAAHDGYLCARAGAPRPLLARPLCRRSRRTQQVRQPRLGDRAHRLHRHTRAGREADHRPRGARRRRSRLGSRMSRGYRPRGTSRSGRSRCPTPCPFLRSSSR